MKHDPSAMEHNLTRYSSSCAELACNSTPARLAEGRDLYRKYTGFKVRRLRKECSGLKSSTDKLCHFEVM